MNHAGDFKAQLGDGNNPGLLSLEQRLAMLPTGQNPYVTGAALPGNSPVFFGRTRLLHEILSSLRKPDRPGSVSLLGERRIGKSSLLNQVYQALAQEPGLVSLHASAQNWGQHSRQAFFTALQHGIAQAIAAAANPTVHRSHALRGNASWDALRPESDHNPPSHQLGKCLPHETRDAERPGLHSHAERGNNGIAPIADYPGLRDFIGDLARRHGYRFVLMLDEFEVMAGNPHFDATFFSNLRALADNPDYRFGYLVSSRRPLKDLCRRHQIEASSFWNIFGAVHHLGLLEAAEAGALLGEPFQRSLPQAPRPPLEAIFPLTGTHPLLLQLAADRYWSAADAGYALAADDAGLILAMRNYLEDGWYQRTQDELSLLIRAAAGRDLGHSPLPLELTQRGLLVQDPASGRLRPFCDEFQRVIEENLPPGKTLAQAVEALEQDAERAAKLFDAMEKVAIAAGKLYAAFKGKGNGDGESEA